METRQISKKSGGFRTIYMPNKEEKEALRAKLPMLHVIQKKHCPSKIVHGFSKGHNIVTNAMQHIGKQYTTCFDIKDFFDSVTSDMIARILCPPYLSTSEEAKEWMEDFHVLYDHMFVDGAARQGLPTSPLLANIAASIIDKELIGLTNSGDIVYTRYADDLAFSYDLKDFEKMLLKLVPEAITKAGFQINEKKTRTMSAKKGRRIITGVAVGDKDIFPPRRIKRKLRAAIHNKNRKTAMGFTEYCKLKLPREMCFEAFEKWKSLLFNRIQDRIVARKSQIFPLSSGVVHKEGN